jgi:hypothetical protein
MTAEQLQIREQFKIKRLGYYQAGRYLAFSSVGVQSYYIMLGYAVEMHIKAAIAELEFKGVKLNSTELKLLYSHKIKDLYHLAKNYGLYEKVEVSDYFLELVENFLHTRYPSQETESRKRIVEKNYEVSVYNVFPYDDFICQLDQQLYALSGDENDSIILLAAKHLNSSDNIPVMHCNAFAFEMLAPIKDKLLNNSSLEEHHRELLSKETENIWLLRSGIFVPFDMYDEILEKYNCLEFKLNSFKMNTDEFGNQTFDLFSNRPIGLRG